MGSFQDAAGDILDKGSVAFSEFTDAAGGFAIKAKVKMQLVDQGLEYDSLMKKLGEAVYEEIRNDERYTAAHSDLFAQIAEVQARKQALENEYARIDAQGDQSEGDAR
jgi:hypothetical protein